MKKIVLSLILITVIALLWFFLGERPAPPLAEDILDTSEEEEREILSEVAEYIASKSDLIVVEEPEPLAEVISPLIVKGEARGFWFFEGDFPLVLTDWDGRIIAEGYATAQDEWMTEEYVPFVGTVTFDADTSASNSGAVIFKKSNAADFDTDDALEIPILFK